MTRLVVYEKQRKRRARSVLFTGAQVKQARFLARHGERLDRRQYAYE